MERSKSEKTRAGHVIELHRMYSFHSQMLMRGGEMVPSVDPAQNTDRNFGAIDSKTRPSLWLRKARNVCGNLINDNCLLCCIYPVGRTRDRCGAHRHRCRRSCNWHGRFCRRRSIQLARGQPTIKLRLPGNPLTCGLNARHIRRRVVVCTGWRRRNNERGNVVDGLARPDDAIAVCQLCQRNTIRSRSRRRIPIPVPTIMCCCYTRIRAYPVPCLCDSGDPEIHEARANGRSRS